MKAVEQKYDELRYKTGGYYTNERNKQIIIYLLKKYGIKRVVVSPGATNFAFVGSLQHDSFFEMYSCVDERAAAYMAIGMAKKSKEPVVLSCTGATASRNYMAALTYAYRQNIPILVVTSSLSLASVGHLKAQVTDREHSPIDMVFRSYQFDNIKDAEDEWSVNVKCNEALANLLLNKKPVLINVCTTYDLRFQVRDITGVRYIPTYTSVSSLPAMPGVRICIFIGSHQLFSKVLEDAIDNFCDYHDAVVLCDHTSGYNGKYKVNMSLPFAQELYNSPNRHVGLLIHLGEISGDYYTFGGLVPQTVWRVNPDGAYSDFFKKLSAVFKMEEIEFFRHYTTVDGKKNSFFKSCRNESNKFYNMRPEVPFSNIWIASQLHDKIPAGFQLHFGILNSLRSWDFFNLPVQVESKSNVGGFGIDGNLSSMIGAALMSPNKIFLGIIGDLSFYYDANVLLNKRLPSNIRLIIVNNGRGIEFRNYCHPAILSLGNSVDSYVAAAGHFGNNEKSAVKSLCEESDFSYYGVSSKDEFKEVIPVLLTSKIENAVIVEVFTDPEKESEALRKYRQCIQDHYGSIRRLKTAIRFVKRKIGR